MILRVVLTVGLAMSFAFTGAGAAEVAQASTPGEACLFNAPYGADFWGTPLYFGHMGWGYQNVAGGDWVYGADEGGARYIPPGSSRLDAWSSTGSFQQMLHAFGFGTHYNKGSGYYVSYKCVTAANSNPAAAHSAMESQYASGYTFFTNTCLTKAVAILQAYGADAPTPIGVAYAPNYYYKFDLPSDFSAPNYLTVLTVRVKVVDPLNGQYLNTDPVHLHRPIRITINDSDGQPAYDSGPFSAKVMATLTLGTDSYHATVQLPPNQSTYHGLWSSKNGSHTYGALVQLQYTLPSFTSITITQGASSTSADVPLTAGDVNGDGSVNIKDYNLMMQCYSDLAPPVGPCPSNQQTAADLNDDGAVNGIDYNEMLRVFESHPNS